LRALFVTDRGDRRQRIAKGSLTYLDVAKCYLYPKKLADDDKAKKVAQDFARTLRRYLEERYGMSNHKALIRHMKDGYEMGNAWHPIKPMIGHSEPGVVSYERQRDDSANDD